MKAIISPVDFSPTSLSAARYAAEMANHTGATLYLMYACVVPVAVSEIPVPAENIDEVVQDAEKELQTLKENLQHVIGSQLQIHTEVRIGSFLQELQDFCSALNPDAVVVGTSSRGGLEKFILGNATLQAVGGLRWPLLIIPPGASFNGVRKIGLACDMKRVAGSIPADEIKQFVREFHAHLHVVHVSEKTTDEISFTSLEEIDRLETMLQELAPIYHYMTRKDIDEGIAEFAEKAGLDLLIVIPRKHGLVGELFHKSHTKQVLLHTHTPIMTIHE